MSLLDFNNTILANGINPINLDKWDVTNVQLGKFAGKDSFVLHNNAELLQRIDKEKIIYNPTQYRIRIVGSMPRSTTNFNWYLAAKLKFIYKDSTSDTCYTTFLPGLSTINNVMTLDAYVDVKPSPELMRIEFKLITFNMPQDERIYIQQVYLEPSIAVDRSIEDAIQKSLPNMVIYANTLDTQINTTLISLAFITMGMVGYANLSMHIFMQGTATADGTLQLEISLDNKPQPYSPIKIPVKQGFFCIGLPLSLAQVGTGSRSVGVSAKMLESEVTLSIPKGSFVVSIEGKNIEGGSNAEPPHAEITTIIGTPTWGNSMLRRSNKKIVVQHLTDINVAHTSKINKNTLNFTEILYDDSRQTLSVKPTIRHLGDIFFTNIQEIKNMDVPEAIKCSDTGMQIKTVTSSLVHNEPGGGGNPFYSFHLPDKTVFPKVISIVPENHAQTAEYFFTLEHKDDIKISPGVTLNNVGASWDGYTAEVNVALATDIGENVYSYELSLANVSNILDILEV